LAGETADGNLLCVGAPGSDKTRMVRELMRSVVPIIGPGLDHRLLVYDLDGDLVSELHGMKPLSD
jgi:hypothetical protein